MQNFTVSQIYKLSLRHIMWYMKSTGSHAKSLNAQFKLGLTLKNICQFRTAHASTLKSLKIGDNMLYR